MDICDNTYSNYNDIYSEYDVVKYFINHTIDICGNLFYSIDKVDCITDNWVNEMYDTRHIKSNVNDIYLTIGTDKEYLTYNRNELASKIFNVDVAGNVVFYFSNEFLNDVELYDQIKSIKNYAIRTGLVKAENIKI